MEKNIMFKFSRHEDVQSYCRLPFKGRTKHNRAMYRKYKELLDHYQKKVELAVCKGIEALPHPEY